MPRIPTSRTLAALIFAAAVALVAAGCNGSKNPTSPGGGGGGGGGANVTINILGENGANSFSPSPDTVSVGQTVAWHNSDSVTHTATGNGFNTGNIAAGGTSAPITFNTAGTLNYVCNIHPSMTGILVVKQ